MSNRPSKDSNRVTSSSVSITQLLLPVRIFFNRIAFFVFVLLAIVSISLSKTKPEVFEQFRVHVVDVVTPALAVIASPIEALKNSRDYLSSLTFVYEENTRLRNENIRLKTFQTQVEQLKNENRHLREIVKFIPDNPHAYMSARVITDSSGPFSRSAIVSIDENSNVQKGAVVLNRDGVVGRIKELGDGTARILLITDINSRIPVATEITGERAIVAGTNSNALKLIHLPLDSNATVGEKLYTTGDGAYFPAGLPVGIIESVSTKGVIARPLVDWSRLLYVNIVDYNYKK